MLSLQVYCMHQVCGLYVPLYCEYIVLDVQCVDSTELKIKQGTNYLFFMNYVVYVKDSQITRESM